MASKNINVLLSMVDEFSKPMEKAGNTTKDTEKKMKSAQQTIAHFGSSANKKFLSMAGSLTKVVAGATAVAGAFALVQAKAFLSDSIEKAHAQIEAETKLSAILQNVKSIQEQGAGAVEKTKNELISYAGALQKTGVIGDEVTISGMQQLATFQLNGDQIKTLSVGMTDLIAQQKGVNATQQDAVGIANLIGKAMMGNVGALSRVGITLSEEEKAMIKSGDATQRASVIAQVLKNNVGGVNKALAETDLGKAQQTMNAFGDMQEEVGKKLDVVKSKILGAFAPVIPLIQTKVLYVIELLQAKFYEIAPSVDDLGAMFVSAFEKICNAIEIAWNIAKGLFNFFMIVVPPILPLLAGIVAGFTAFNVVMKCVAMFKALGTAIKLCRHATLLFNLVMAMNPLVLVALAIAGLVAVLVLLYTKFEFVRNIVNGVFGAFMEFAQGVISTIAPLIQSAIANIVAHFNYWYQLVQPVIQMIGFLLKALANVVLSVIAPIFSVAIAGICGAFQGWWDSACTICAGVMQALDGVVQFVTGVFTGNWSQAWEGVKNIFKGVFDALVGIAKAPLDIIGGFVSGLCGRIGTMLSDLRKGKEEANNGLTAGGGHATGTSYFGGGLTHINENQRGEIVDLPNGTRIIPHDLSKRILGGGSAPNVSVNLTVQGNVIGNYEFMNQMGNMIAGRITTALANQ